MLQSLFVYNPSSQVFVPNFLNNLEAQYVLFLVFHISLGPTRDCMLWRENTLQELCFQSERVSVWFYFLVNMLQLQHFLNTQQTVYERIHNKPYFEFWRTAVSTLNGTRNEKTLYIDKSHKTSDFFVFANLVQLLWSVAMCSDCIEMAC